MINGSMRTHSASPSLATGVVASAQPTTDPHSTPYEDVRNAVPDTVRNVLPETDPRLDPLLPGGAGLKPADSLADKDSSKDSGGRGWLAKDALLGLGALGLGKTALDEGRLIGAFGYNRDKHTLGKWMLRAVTNAPDYETVPMEGGPQLSPAAGARKMWAGAKRILPAGAANAIEGASQAGAARMRGAISHLPDPLEHGLTSAATRFGEGVRAPWAASLGLSTRLGLLMTPMGLMVGATNTVAALEHGGPGALINTHEGRTGVLQSVGSGIVGAATGMAVYNSYKQRNGFTRSLESDVSHSRILSSPALASLSTAAAALTFANEFGLLDDQSSRQKMLLGAAGAGIAGKALLNGIDNNGAGFLPAVKNSLFAPTVDAASAKAGDGLAGTLKAPFEHVPKIGTAALGVGALVAANKLGAFNFLNPDE